MKKYVEGYKAFSSDWKCMDFQFEVGKTFEEDVTPCCCKRGFHFCKALKDCFKFYPFSRDTRVAKVIALGEVDVDPNSSKCCTNKIQIVEEISWEDVFRMVNIGTENLGLCNTGDYNAGEFNSSSRNMGCHNTGESNIGDWNSGSWNIGDINSGCWNIGNWNTGSHNIGDWNSGDCNNGDCNSGKWNKTSFSNGCFNTEEPKIFLFNKPSDWTYSYWLNSEANYLLNKMQRRVVDWVWSKNMTYKEKRDNPKYKVVGGYLKILDESEGAQLWWNSLSESDKDIIKAIPNFDKKIFEDILGIKI